MVNVPKPPSALRRFGRKTWKLLVRARGYFPLTNLGVLLALLAGGAYLALGVPRVDYVIQLVGLLAVAMVALALVVVLPGWLGVGRAFKRRAAVDTGAGPSVFEAHRGFTDLLHMPAIRWMPLIDVDWKWVQPEGFKMTILEKGGERVERVEATERAEATEIVRRFVIEDAFGLARIELTRKQKRSLRVLPWTGRLASSPMLRSHAGGEDLPHPLGVLEGDRVDMRHYVPGDPLRLALWKVYARTGELMVRTPERAISPSLKIIAYLPSAQADEPAAAAARVAVESGMLGEGWVLSADGANHPAEENVQDAVNLIVGSRRVRDTDAGEGAGLEAFVESIEDARRARLVLFLPARSGPWLARVLDAVSHWGGAVTAVIATDGVRDPGAARPPSEKWLKLPEPIDPHGPTVTTPQEIADVARALASRGVHVFAVERPTGKQINLGVRAAPRRVA